MLEVLQRPGQLLIQSAPGPGPDGYYRFHADPPGADLFLKVLANERERNQRDADRVATWLQGRGLHVNCLAPDFPRPLDPEHLILAYPLIDGRCAQTSERDLAALGRLLGETHRALRELPWAIRIERHSRSRDQWLEGARTRLMTPAGWPPFMAEHGPALLAATSTRLPTSGRQPVHGDINPGNLLFRNPDQSPVLLDFEDSVHNCHTPAMDLAMAVERFVLLAEPDDVKALELGRTLLTGYRERNPTRQAFAAIDPGALLRALAARALVLLALAHAQGRTPARTEWEKFLQLHAQTRHRARLLQRLWTG